MVNPNNDTIEHKNLNNKKPVSAVTGILNSSQIEDECDSIDKIVRGLNNTIKAVKSIIGRAVVASGKTGSSRTVETSFIIVTRQNPLDVSEKENAKYIYGKSLLISKSSNSVGFDLKNWRDNEFIGQLHTHFYSKKQGSYTGIPHSTTDISNLRMREEGFMDFVHSDTKIYAIVITNINKAQKNIFEKFTEDDLLEKYRKLSSEADNPTTIEEMELLYTEIIVKILGKEEESGLGSYVTTNDAKDCFKKLN